MAEIAESQSDLYQGANIFFGHSDINSTSSSDPNDTHLLFTLIDNVQIGVPEPTGLAPIGLAAIGLLARRRRQQRD